MFTGGGDTAQEIQEIAEDFYPKVTSDLGHSVKRKITIWFCESQKEFSRAVNAPIQDWAAGCAYPLQLRVVIRDPASMEDKRLNLSRLVKHEIAHVILGNYLDQNLKNVPMWFNEGVVMYEADEWSYGHYWTMLIGTLSDSLIPLSDLSEEFPRIEAQAQKAYAQSCSVVSFMVRRYGVESLKECIRLLSTGREFDEALASATGTETFWLENKWLKELKRHYRWFSLISSWVVFWGVVILILSIAFVRRKVKNRRIIKQWEEEEELWQVLDEEAEEEDEDTESETWTYRW